MPLLNRMLDRTDKTISTGSFENSVNHSNKKELKANWIIAENEKYIKMAAIIKNIVQIIKTSQKTNRFLVQLLIISNVLKIKFSYSWL